MKSKLQRREFLGCGSLLAAGVALDSGASVKTKDAKNKTANPKVKIGMNLLLWTANPSEQHFSLLDTIKTWGFDGAEFPMFEPSGEHWGKLGRHCEELGLARTVSACVPEKASPVSPEASVRQAAADFLKRCVDRSQELGAKTICGPFYAPVGKLVGRGRTEEEFARCAEVLRGAAEYAQKAGIQLALEPINRFETYVFNCQEDGGKMVDAVAMPNFGLLYDTFHAHIEEKNVGAAIRHAGKRILHVHISENDRSTPGAGQVRWPETFAALKAIGYDRWLTIEAFGRAMPEVAAATCIWRSMFTSEEQLSRDGLKFLRANWAV